MAPTFPKYRSDGYAMFVVVFLPDIINRSTLSFF